MVRIFSLRDFLKLISGCQEFWVEVLAIKNCPRNLNDCVSPPKSGTDPRCQDASGNKMSHCLRNWQRIWEWLNVAYKCESWKAGRHLCSGAEIKAGAYIHIK